MTDLAQLVAKHGATAKLVRAYCKERGGRHDAQGAPPQWYAAWRDGLATELAPLLLAVQP